MRYINEKSFVLLFCVINNLNGHNMCHDKLIKGIFMDACTIYIIIPFNILNNLLSNISGTFVTILDGCIPVIF